ncbi:hypothetical protein SD20_00680 [Treponema pallidum subsp. pallidum]|nr:hypothetical protein SD20_00680 [Treponema pallidum subsp. pallidum]
MRKHLPGQNVTGAHWVCSGGARGATLLQKKNSTNVGRGGVEFWKAVWVARSFLKGVERKNV